MTLSTETFSLSFRKIILFNCLCAYFFFFFERQKLIVTPFAPLIQDYQTCTTDAQTAFIDQVGITLGNMGLVTPFIVAVVILLIYTYQECFGQPIMEMGYSVDAKEEMMDNLVISLLLSKDRNEVEEVESTIPSKANGDASKLLVKTATGHKGPAGSTPEKETGHHDECENLLSNLAKSIEKYETLYDEPEKLYLEIEMLRQRRLYAKRKQQTVNQTEGGKEKEVSMVENPMKTK